MLSLIEDGRAIRKAETGNRHGFCRPATKPIVLSVTGNGAQHTKTIVHETAHSVADHCGMMTLTSIGEVILIIDKR